MFEKEFEERRKELVNSFRKKIASLRVGRPNPEMVEFLLVSAYGKKMPLRGLASIGIVPPNQISIQVWDESIIPSIKEAIKDSEINLPVQVEGKTIRLIVPPLTQERREEIVKLLNKMKEETRIALKNIRNEIIKRIEKAFENNEISEDDKFRNKEKIQKKLEEANKEIEGIALRKEEEILS